MKSWSGKELGGREQSGGSGYYKDCLDYSDGSDISDHSEESERSEPSEKSEPSHQIKKSITKPQ